MWLEYLKMTWITFIPTLELRASIPYGIFISHLPWLKVFIVCIIANIGVGIVVYILMDFIIKVLTTFAPVAKWWQNYVARTQHRIQHGVDKYGEWAVAIFIGIPLPGSGVYTGALAAYLIGLKFRKFMVANIFGVLIAGVIVTAICLTGSGISSIFIKRM